MDELRLFHLLMVLEALDVLDVLDVVTVVLVVIVDKFRAVSTSFSPCSGFSL